MGQETDVQSKVTMSKTQKMVLDAFLLNSHYKVLIKVSVAIHEEE